MSRGAVVVAGAATTFSARGRRQPAARDPGRGARRAGLVPLALRAAAGPGVPVLRHRPVGCRPRRRAAATPGQRWARDRRGRRGACHVSRRHGGPGAARFVAVRARVLVGVHPVRCLLRLRRRPSRRSTTCSSTGSRVWWPSRWAPPFIGLLPGFQREWRFHRLPSIGIAGAPLLGRRLRGRLDAVHRPDARRRAGAGERSQHRHGGPRRAADRCLLRRAGPALHPRRAGVPASARRVRGREAALRLGACAAAACC